MPLDKGCLKFLKSHEKNSNSEEPVCETKPKKNLVTYLEKYTKIKSEGVRIFMGECLGETIYITIGLCSIAQFKFQHADGSPLASAICLYMGYMVGLIFAVLIVGKISGPNISTAISFARLLIGDINFWRFLIYAGAQFLGAFIGSVITYIIYLDRIKTYSGGEFSLDMAAIFTTIPTGKLSHVAEFFQQSIATGIITLVFLALTDKKNTPVSHGLTAIDFGYVIIMKTCAFSYTLSNSVNPARDFSPRLFTCIAGWGGQVFSTNNYFFWIPLVSPLVGATFAVFIYFIVVSVQIQTPNKSN